MGCLLKIIDDATLQRLEELEKRATPLPWLVDECGAYVECEEDVPRGFCAIERPIDIGSTANASDDIAFAAAVVNASPLLLDSVRRLKEAFLLAREWAGRDPISAPETYQRDMARITALVYGDV